MQCLQPLPPCSAFIQPSVRKRSHPANMGGTIRYVIYLESHHVHKVPHSLSIMTSVQGTTMDVRWRDAGQVAGGSCDEAKR